MVSSYFLAAKQGTGPLNSLPMCDSTALDHFAERKRIVSTQYTIRDTDLNSAPFLRSTRDYNHSIKMRNPHQRYIFR